MSEDTQPCQYGPTPSACIRKDDTLRNGVRAAGWEQLASHGSVIAKYK
jgi:hypothetical protein